MREHCRDVAAVWTAILERLDCERHLVPSLERGAAIADRENRGRRLSLRSPLDRLAVLTFDVEDQHTVRVGIHPLLDGALQNHFFPGIERRTAVVCEYWTLNPQRGSDSQ